MIIEWFDITGFTNIHVYTYTPNYIYNSGRGGISWNWRESDLCQIMSILDGAILFECLVIYMLSQNFQNLTHTVSIQNLTSFSFCWKCSGRRWIFKEYSRCDFFTLKGRMGTQFSEMFWTFCNKISLLWFMERKL